MEGIESVSAGDILDMDTGSADTAAAKTFAIAVQSTGPTLSSNVIPTHLLSTWRKLMPAAVEAR